MLLLLLRVLDPGQVVGYALGFKHEQMYRLTVRVLRGFRASTVVKCYHWYSQLTAVYSKAYWTKYSCLVPIGGIP